MIGIISAMKFEMEGILSIVNVEEKKINCDLEFYICSYNNAKFVLSACGEGKVNASRCAQIMISCYAVKDIINIGVAGGLAQEANIGKLVLAHSVVQYDFDMTGLGVEKGLIPRGIRSERYPVGNKAKIFYECSTQLIKVIKDVLNIEDLEYEFGIIATGDAFVSDKKLKKNIAEQFGAIACDMEGAAVAHVCDCGEIGFAELRKISDDADEVADINYFASHKQYKIEEVVVKIIEGYCYAS